MASGQRLTVIGGGAMGEAFIAGVLREGGPVSAPNVIIVEPVAARRETLVATYGVQVSTSPREAVAGADLVLLAIKPNQFGVVANELAGAIAGNQLVMTLMAGVELDRVRGALHHSGVIRLMPNILCRVGAGMIVWVAAPDVTAEQREAARCLFAATGAEFEVDDEKYLDMATAVSGSGPAYVFLMLEALADAGVHVGFSRPQAALLAQQTLLGAAMLARQSGQHPAELRNTVTSPGGTTVEGLLALERGGVRAAIIEAVLAAYTKAQKLR